MVGVNVFNPCDTQSNELVNRRSSDRGDLYTTSCLYSGIQCTGDVCIRVEGGPGRGGWGQRWRGERDWGLRMVNGFLCTTVMNWLPLRTVSYN